MRQKLQTRETGAAKAIKDIRRATRKQYSAEEKIRIVLDGLRGEETIAELCRREGIAQSIYYKWSKEFLGPEFIAQAMQDWLARVGIKPIRIYPGSPWENGYNERFNGTLRHDLVSSIGGWGVRFRIWTDQRLNGMKFSL